MLEKPKKPRALALEAGDEFYFTGKPCRNGHIAKRYTVAGVCVDCLRDRNDQRQSVYVTMRKAVGVEQLDEIATIAQRMSEESDVWVHCINPARQWPAVLEYAQGMRAARWPGLAWEAYKPRHRTKAENGGVKLLVLMNGEDQMPLIKWANALCPPVAPSWGELVLAGLKNPDEDVEDTSGIPEWRRGEPLP